LSDEGQGGLLHFGWRNRSTNGMYLACFGSFVEAERHNAKQRKGVKCNIMCRIASKNSKQILEGGSHG